MGARGRSGLDICEWVCSDLAKTPSALYAGLWLTGCVVRVCKASKDPFARRALKAARSQQFLSVGIFSLQIESCQGFIGLRVPRMTPGLSYLSSKNSLPALSFGPQHSLFTFSGPSSFSKKYRVEQSRDKGKPDLVLIQIWGLLLFLVSYF